MNRKTCIYRIFNSSIRSQTQLTRRAEALVLPRLGRATDGDARAPLRSRGRAIRSRVQVVEALVICDWRMR